MSRRVCIEVDDDGVIETSVTERVAPRTGERECGSGCRRDAGPDSDGVYGYGYAWGRGGERDHGRERDRDHDHGRERGSSRGTADWPDYEPPHVEDDRY